MIGAREGAVGKEGKESLPGPTGVQKRKPLLHDESLPVEQCVEDPGRSRAGSGDCLSHPASHHAHLQVLGSWYPQRDTCRFIFCKNAELGYLESGPANAPPPLYALVSSGLSPSLRGAHGAGECCARKNWPGYYHAGVSTLPLFS